MNYNFNELVNAFEYFEEVFQRNQIICAVLRDFQWKQNRRNDCDFDYDVVKDRSQEILMKLTEENNYYETAIAAIRTVMSNPATKFKWHRLKAVLRHVNSWRAINDK